MTRGAVARAAAPMQVLAALSMLAGPARAADSGDDLPAKADMP